MDGMGRACSTHGREMGKSVGNIPLRRPSLRQEDNIKIDLKEMERKAVDCIHLPQSRRQG
jgi:hypothetical protein